MLSQFAEPIYIKRGPRAEGGVARPWPLAFGRPRDFNRGLPDRLAPRIVAAQEAFFMLRRILVVGFSVALLVSSAAAALVLWRGTGTDMTVAANAFLATLDEKQRATAVLPYDDAGRVKWHFIPLAERKGLQIERKSGV